MIGLTYAGLLSYPVFQTCWLLPGGGGATAHESLAPSPLTEPCDVIGTVSLTFVVVLGLWAAAGMLLAVHTFLLAVDLTTLQLLAGGHTAASLWARVRARPAGRVTHHLLWRPWWCLLLPWGERLLRAQARVARSQHRD